jgi:hypothetical protein
MRDRSAWVRHRSCVLPDHPTTPSTSVDWWRRTQSRSSAPIHVDALVHTRVADRRRPVGEPPIGRATAPRASGPYTPPERKYRRDLVR